MHLFERRCHKFQWMMSYYNPDYGWSWCRTFRKTELSVDDRINCPIYCPISDQSRIKMNHLKEWIDRNGSWSWILCWCILQKLHKLCIHHWSKIITIFCDFWNLNFTLVFGRVGYLVCPRIWTVHSDRVQLSFLEITV